MQGSIVSAEGFSLGGIKVYENSPEIVLKRYPMRIENIQKIKTTLQEYGYTFIQEQKLLDQIVPLLDSILQWEKSS